MVAFYNAADQELYKKYQYLPQEKYRLGFTAPNTEVQKIENTFGIPATNAFTGGNQNNNYYTGTTGSLVSGFNQAITDRQNRLEELRNFRRRILRSIVRTWNHGSTFRQT